MSGVLYEVADAYRETINADIERIRAHVSDGKATSYEDYKRACGEATGLRKALAQFEEVIRDFIREEEK